MDGATASRCVRGRRLASQKRRNVLLRAADRLSQAAAESASFSPDGDRRQAVGGGRVPRAERQVWSTYCCGDEYFLLDVATPDSLPEAVGGFDLSGVDLSQECQIPRGLCSV